jgi:tetratricopeptide (TPR) repeat protein
MGTQTCLSRATTVFLLGVTGCLLYSGPLVGQRRYPSESNEAQENGVTLGGWVHADYGQAIPNDVAVRLETSEGMVGGEQPTNTSGYFEFVGLSKALYRLTVTASGFQTHQQDVDLRSVGDRLVINVQLSPAAKSPPPPPANSFTDNNAPKKARAEYRKGVRSLRAKNLANAESHFMKATREYPCYARAQTDLALVLSAQRRLPESETALKKSLKCDPDYLDAYNGLGQLFYLEKKYQESAAILQEGLRRSPSSWQFHYQLGADHYYLREYSKAEQEYLKAESLDSAVPAEIHVKLADVYLKQSAYDKAYAEMQAYLRMEPEGRFAAEIKNIMRHMESDRILRAAQPHDSQPSSPKQ